MKLIRFQKVVIYSRYFPYRRVLVFIFKTAIFCWLTIMFFVMLFSKVAGRSQEHQLLSKADAIQWIMENRHKSTVNEGIDPFYLELIRTHFLRPPCLSRYNLHDSGDKSYHRYKTTIPSWMFIHSVLKDLFGNKGPGYFIEAGAFDGEFLSNTLFLEKEHLWKGLLVEPSIKHYKTMRQKCRKAWTAPIAFAIDPWPSTVKLFADGPNEASNTLKKKSQFSGMEKEEHYESVMSLPIRDLLKALDIAKVDLFVLDVEKAEVEILQQFPFDEIDVDVLVIEHIKNYTKDGKSSGKTLIQTYYVPLDAGSSDLQSFIKEEQYIDYSFIQFMEDRGYYLLDIHCDSIADYIFVRINSDIFKNLLRVPRNQLKNRGICDRKGRFDYSAKNNIVERVRDKKHFPGIAYKPVPPSLAERIRGFY